MCILYKVYQALLSPSCSICLLAALSGFVVSFLSICLLATLSGFVVSFPLYLSSCRPIRLYCLLPALSVSLPPFQALLSPSCSICLKGGSRAMLLGGGVPELLGGCEQVRPRQREALAEGAAAGVWGRKNRSPRVLECT